MLVKARVQTGARRLDGDRYGELLPYQEPPAWEEEVVVGLRKGSKAAIWEKMGERGEHQSQFNPWLGPLDESLLRSP